MLQWKNQLQSFSCGKNTENAGSGFGQTGTAPGGQTAASSVVVGCTVGGRVGRTVVVVGGRVGRTVVVRVVVGGRVGRVGLTVVGCELHPALSGQSHVSNSVFQ